MNSIIDSIGLVLSSVRFVVAYQMTLGIDGSRVHIGTFAARGRG